MGSGDRLGIGDHLRGIFLVVMLVAHGIYALPIPKKITWSDMKKPFRARQVERWQGRLERVGIEMDTIEIQTQIVHLTSDLSAFHDTLKDPFRPMFRLTQTNQAWALFAGASTSPGRLVIEIRREGDDEDTWTPIERRLDPCCTWREDQLRYRRLRGIWDGLKKVARPAYRHLVTWIARHALEDFPDAVAVRVRLEHKRTVYPWNPPRPELETNHAYIVERGDPRLELKH